MELLLPIEDADSRVAIRARDGVILVGSEQLWTSARPARSLVDALLEWHCFFTRS